MNEYNLEQTKLLAHSIAARILETGAPRILALCGELGSGKTTFTGFLAHALGISQTILSPTFVITRIYPFHTKQSKATLYHYDLYRLEGDDTVIEELKELLELENTYIVVEWAEKVRDIFPPDTLWIHFHYKDSSTRIIDMPQEHTVRTN